VPCLVHGDLRIWDALAITEYLAERHVGVWPSPVDARAFARCASAEMHSGFNALRNYCSMSVGHRFRLRETPAELTQDLQRLESLWDEGLSRFGGPWLAGTRFTAVDAFFAPVATRVQTYGLELGEAARGYVTHLLAFPAVQAWMDAGIRETFRDEGHEREMLALCDVLQDLRH
jgi:glutathione S-transferase